MDRAWAVSSQRVPMRRGWVTLVAGKTILGVLRIVTDHEAVSRHFRDNGGRRDIVRPCVALYGRVLLYRGGKGCAELTVYQDDGRHEVRNGLRELGPCLCHRTQRGLKDVQSVDLGRVA